MFRTGGGARGGVKHFSFAFDAAAVRGYDRKRLVTHRFGPVLQGEEKRGANNKDTDQNKDT